LAYNDKHDLACCSQIHPPSTCRENKFLRKVTFLRMNEVENLYHATPQHYYKCIRERFGNEKIG
jgi:hypothetical protein